MGMMNCRILCNPCFSFGLKGGKKVFYDIMPNEHRNIIQYEASLFISCLNTHLIYIIIFSQCTFGIILYHLA